jgi:hypothetical protein
MAYTEKFPLSRLLGECTKYLPTWMKMRKDPNCVGSQFLNVFALELEDVEAYLTQCFENVYIETAHVDAIDILWKVECESISPLVQATYKGQSVTLKKCLTIPEFYRSTEHVYIIDFDTKMLYTRLNYDKLFIDGTETVLYLHHVWNHFDEFGLLLGTPRLLGETNAEYKERLLSVFRCPGNATRQGIINSTSRGLGLVRSIAWEDDSLPFFMVCPGITADRVYVDWEKISDTLISVENGFIKINPLSEASPGAPHQVQLLGDVRIYQLWDEDVKPLLYNDDGTANARLKYLAQSIQREVPIMWDEFLWDEGYWDVVERSMNGISYIPNIWDADMEAWRTKKGTAYNPPVFAAEYGIWDESQYDSGVLWK